jgi:hypothetical protein
MNNTTHFKYIKWRDTEGLHQDTLQSISELKFLRDELHFLNDLVAEHTLEIIYGKSHEEAARIGTQLHTHQNRLRQLLKDMKEHSNNLKFLTDDVDVPNELKDYKDTHYNLMISMMGFHSGVKRTKRTIFKMLAEIMKKSKQKRVR